MSSLAHPDWSGRLDRVRASLDAYQIDALVISGSTNIFYLTGFSGSAGLLVVTPDRARLMLDGRYELVARQAIDAGTVARVTIDRVEGRYDQALGQVVAHIAPRRVGFEAAQVTVATLRAW
jgi:Xaa-Pro aminopeptidase